MKLFNSLTHQTEELSPVTPGSISMYVCGPTVYDTPHLGNFRSVVVFDILYRVLKSLYRVHYVRNFTDVDDKIISKAEQLGISIDQLTSKSISEFLGVCSQLNVLSPDVMPRVSENMDSIIKFISDLQNAGNTYMIDGNVLFKNHESVSQLVQHDQSLLLSGVRDIKSVDKHRDADFVLWKPSEPTEQGWNSPWGWGRPGWHIECSSLIREYMGTSTIDIHGGGNDLKFPHHSCEILQSETANGNKLANYWIHNGMLLIEGRKMSKSLNNVITVDSLLGNGIDPDVIRLCFASALHTKPLNWTEGLLQQSTAGVERWKKLLAGYSFEGDIDNTVLRSLQLNFNFPMALFELNKLMKDMSKQPSNELAQQIMSALSILGFRTT